MKKSTLIAIFGILLVASLFSVSASSCAYKKYNSENYDYSYGVITLGDYQSSVDYYSIEDEDRYPLYDYRHGYSYRTTDEYQDRKEFLDYYSSNYRDNSPASRTYSSRNDDVMSWLFDGKQTRVVYQDSPNYYYEYVGYLERYEKHECYVNPPRDKLIYTKCP